MARSLALLAFSSAVLAAQTTTVKLLLPFADPQPLVASVVAADSSATTYAVGCPPGTDSDECGFAESQTITQGPSTYAFTMAYSGDEGSYTEIAHCKLSSAVDVASCSASVSQDDGNGNTMATASVGTVTFLDLQLPVTVTAGLDKLQAAPGATATDSSAPTGTGSSAASQTTAASGAAPTTLARQTTTTGTQTGTHTGTQTTSSTAGPTTTNAAGVLNARNGLLVGVAAIIGSAMML
ncbi:hypothetical protein MKX07_008572 [Trichoderma sp. CBMAI-0711]|uniref:HFB protein n=1 Tax=Trichoderma parareesei TaxID=858221 RepID=A0A2H2ZSK8_TRIPA|nr:hypothetical protein MKX07_008572 [Trichoderma sp. CBMAI-0711]OTA08618.1 HFB protein [Trichoderma parareesei]